MAHENIEKFEHVEKVDLTALDAGTSKEAAQLPDPDGDSAETRATSLDSALPPADGGKAAWLFLAACWMIEALVFGFGFSFGIFQDYLSKHEPFASSDKIAVIGTTTTGTLYLGTPLVIALCRLLPQWAPWFPLMGIFTAAFAMLMSSFCHSVPPLIGTQGVLFGLGGCFAFCTCAMYIDEWFLRRKGMAYGIMWSAAGLGGVVLPLILQALLDNLGFQTATRIWAAILFASAAPFTFFIKPRLPYSAVKHKKKLNLRFTTSKIFITHQVANFIHATGYFLPGIFLPTYARETFGTSTIMSTLTVILLNLASATGCIIMGIMTDKLPVTTCIIVAAVGAAISVLLFWGLAVSLPMLYVFCVLYGLTSGSWTSIWPGMMKETSQRGEDEGYGFVDPLLVYSFLCIGRGVGNLIAGPLSGAFLDGMPWQGEVIGGYGSGYGVLIVYTGVTGLLGGLNFLWKCLHWI